MFSIRAASSQLRKSSVATLSRSSAIRHFSPSCSVLEKRRITVPQMGESVREGTIVEWTAKVGQAVKADDVIAMVETDKVTIEIRAEIDGVISDYFAEIDETVDVGGDLYEIDTEGVASAASTESVEEPAAAPSPVSEPLAAAAAVSPSTSSTSSAEGQRVPSIKFLGKEGWAQLLSGSSSDSGVTTLYDIDPMYGRPMFTEEEMEALVMGGASVAPDVTYHSSGAKFIS